MKHRLPPPALIALGAVIVVAAAAVIFVRPDPDDVEALFADGGALGPVLFVIAYALLTVALVPGSPLTIAAGALYGIAGGAIVSVIGATAGATAAYAIARHSTRDAVARVRGDRLRAIEDRLRGRGLLALFLLRLLPVVPFNALNYAAGATAIGVRDYLVATGFGIIPGVVLFAALGAGLDDPASPTFVVAALAVVALAVAARKMAGPRPPADGDGDGKDSSAPVVAPAPAAPGDGDGPPAPVIAPTPAAEDRLLRRLVWSGAFFIAALGGFAVLSRVGLFH